MRLGLCPQLRRLWMRLVTKTVLPERLKPVTASQAVAPPASSPRLLDSRSDAWAKIGGSQPQFITDDIPIPIASDRSRRRSREAVSRGPLEYGFPLARRRQEVCQNSRSRKPLSAWTALASGSPHARPLRSGLIE